MTFCLVQADNGFDELRRLMKQGSDFLKEVASILNERFAGAGKRPVSAPERKL